MDYNEIRNNIDAGKYNGDVEYPDMKRMKKDTIIDPTKSKIWNQDQVQQHNDNLDAHLLMYRNSEREAQQQFENDCLNYAAHKVSTVIEGDVFCNDLMPIYNLAYESGHSSGYNEILIYFGEYLDTFVEVMNNLNKRS